jgi:hypothetical protein
VKTFLQILHLILLILTFTLILTFKWVSGNEDYGRKAIDFSFYLVLGIWPVLILILILLKNIEAENAYKTIMKMYRMLLNNLSFLLLSNVLMLTITSFLFYLFINFRQVEFLSKGGSIQIFQDVDGTGNDPLLGTTTPAQSFKRRMPVGSDPHLLILRYNNIERSYFLFVPPFWKSSKLNIIDPVIETHF